MSDGLIGLMVVVVAVVTFGGLYVFQEWRNWFPKKTTQPATPNGATFERTPSHERYTQPDSSRATVAREDTPPLLAPEYNPINPLTLSPRKRRHTLLSAPTGGGKTVTTYTLLVNDVRSGAQCVVLSTHYTPFHYEDQQIDLRPIADRFEAYYTPETIKTALTNANDLIDARMIRYRNNEDVGHDIVLYVGEWGAIARILGKQTANELLQKLLDEGRKTRIWIVIELHSAVVARFGDSSALREAFLTRLVGDVDLTTWKFAVGNDIPKQPVPPRHWMTTNGLVEVIRPDTATIAAIATQSHVAHIPLVPPSQQPLPMKPQPTVLIGDDYVIEDDTSTDTDEDLFSALIDAGRTSSHNSDLADTYQVNPDIAPVVPTGTPRTSTAQFEDATSIAIAALVTSGYSANKIIDTLQLSGSRADKLAQIRTIREQLQREENV